ncbi:MAG: ribbon-helix-helix domain-containing protein [Promethearchaeota archaeon]
MPIISFNISDNLKMFLKRMVTKEEYKNNSYVIREALIRLMNEKDGALSGTGAIDVESESQLDHSSLLPKLSASLLVSIRKGDSKTEKKINKLEVNYHDTIIHKTCFSIEDFKTITYILDDNLPVIQSFITELNSLKDLQSFRYIINTPEE